MPHTVKLIHLLCHVPDESDLDEIYLKMNGEKIWPESQKFQRLNFGETEVNCSIPNIEKGDIIELEIWDYDTLSRDDKLGVFTLVCDQFGSGYETEMKKHGNTKASYSLGWEFF